MCVLNKIHKNQFIAQSLLEIPHNLCLHIYILILYLLLFSLFVTLHHHTATKGSGSGLFKAKTKDVRV